MKDEHNIAEQLQELGVNILSVSRNELYIGMRFLDVALSSLSYAADMSTGTLGTDGYYLYYNPRYLGGIYKENIVLVNRAYFHMVLHCILRHMVKPAGWQDLLWDLSCDIVVESIADGLYVKSVRTSRSWLRRETYRRLKESIKVFTPRAVGKTIRSWELESEELCKLIVEFTVDDHCYWIEPEEEEKQSSLNQKWEDISEQMETDMETFSKESAPDEGSLLEQVQIENRDRYDYRQFLKKFTVLREEMRVDEDTFDYTFYSYGLQLYGNMPLIEPQEWTETLKIEEFVIVIDTSMSCSGELVKKFLEETYHVLSEVESFFRKVHIHIIQCDEKVQADDRIGSRDELKEYMDHLQLRGDGGTDFRPAFDYVNQMVADKKFEHLKGLLYFTDGYGTYPVKMPPYETAFLFMEEDYDDSNVPPWAMKIVVREEDLEDQHREDGRDS